MKNIFFCFFLFLGTYLHSQTKSQILKALLESHHALDKDADYSYLVNSSSIKYVIPSNWDIHVNRSYNKTIKIYNEKGLDEADVIIPLWKSNRGREKVVKIKVRLHKLEKGTLISEEIKINKYEEKNEDLILYKFNIPDVKVGDIIELKYMISSPFVTVLPRFYFQHLVPVDSAQYTIDVPGYFALYPNLKGYEKIQVTDKKIMSDHFEVRYTLRASNLPSMDKPSFVMNQNDYRTSIKYEIESYTIPGRGKVKLSSSWNNVGENIWDDWKFGKALKHKDFKELPRFETIPDTLDKITSAVNYVHENFTWNKEVFNKNPNIKKLIKNKSGNLLDINLALINILNRIGIKATPLITQKRSFGYINDKFPSRGNFNNILTYIKLSNGYIIVDLTDKHLDIGQVDISNRNFSGLVLHKEKKAEFIHFDTNNIFKKQTQSKISFDKDRSLMIYRKEKLTSSAKIEYINDSQNNPNSNYDLKNNPTIERNSPLHLEYDYLLTDATLEIEDKIILPVCIDCPISPPTFIEKIRNYPIILPYKIKQSYIYQLNIPLGYEINTIPQDLIIKNENEMINLTRTIRTLDGKITVSLLFEVKKEIFSPHEYNSLKYTMDNIIENLNDNIVLQKT